MARDAARTGVLSIATIALLCWFLNVPDGLLSQGADYAGDHAPVVLLARDTDCHPSGKWLGIMPLSKCAEVCAKWGRFMHAADRDSDCKCADIACTPTTKGESAGVALFQLQEMPAPGQAAPRLEQVSTRRARARTTRMPVVGPTSGHWTRVAQCRGHGTLGTLQFSGEITRYLAAAASHVKICMGEENHCSMSEAAFYSARKLQRSPCSWLRRSNHSFAVYLSNNDETFGLKLKTSDCQPSGPWLGKMSITKCALSCVRWGRFVYQQKRGGICKCAEEACQGVADKTSAVYRPDAAFVAMLKVDNVLQMLVRQPNPFKFESCALVGSSGNLLHQGLGKQIEAHDTLIRVNRVPTKNYTDDYGRRTDILFMGASAKGKQMFTSKGQNYWKFGGKRSLCEFDGKRCPFKMVVFKSSRGLRASWLPERSHFLLARTSAEVAAFAYSLLRLYLKNAYVMPTTGFEAFVTFGLLCKSMTMYGFSGNGTVDGHRFTGVHSIKGVMKEHELVQRVLKGDLRMDPSRLDARLLRRLQDRPGAFKVV